MLVQRVKPVLFLACGFKRAGDGAVLDDDRVEIVATQRMEVVGVDAAAVDSVAPVRKRVERAVTRVAASAAI